MRNLEDLLSDEGRELLEDNLKEMVLDGFAHKEMKPKCFKIQFVSDSGMISVLTLGEWIEEDEE